jgi:hypothetical protein
MRAQRRDSCTHPRHQPLKQEALQMKKEVRIGLTFLSSFALAAALWAFSPARGSAQSPQAQSEQTAAAQSVSGKIASVEQSSFTLTVGGSDQTAPPGSSHVSTAAAAKTMTFEVDQNTTVDGKLKVGANADVTYRQDGDKNIAISVRVS